MSQYLSLSAFAYKIGCSQSAIEKLIAEERIKAYQLGVGEPFIRRAELSTAKGMISQDRQLTDNEENIIQAEKDRVSRIASRARVATESKEQEIKLEQRRLRLKRHTAP